MHSIRAASTSVAPLLSELGARLFEQALGRQNAVEDMRLYLSTAFSIDRWSTNLSNPAHRTWVADNPSGAAIGYAVLNKGPAPAYLGATSAAEIARLYSDQAWHGRGVGGALMNACLDQARAWKCDIAWLGVWVENARAIAFYEKHGFRVVGAQTFLLGTDVQHDHVMARRLD